MKIVVKAKTGSKVEKVERITEEPLGLPGLVRESPVYRVLVKDAPVDGKANRAIIKALSKYFAVPQGRVSLIKGESSKTKIFEIN